MTSRARIAATALLATLALAGCGDEEGATDAGAEPRDPSSGATSATSDPTASGDATDDPSADPSDGAGAGDSVAVPVYLVGRTPQGPRLFREFHQVPAADPLLGAAQVLTTGDVLDPDYRSLLTGTTITGVTADASSIVVTVEPGAFATDLSRAEARAGVQSLVYTLQGAAQGRVPVLVQDATGQPVPLLGTDTAGGLTQADELDVLALVSITNPEEGAAVSGTFTAEGVASSFEATVPWQVLDASGAVALDGFATAEGWLDRLYPWSTSVDVSGLAPGTYTFVARTDDPSDGEGPGPTKDTRTITVS